MSDGVCRGDALQVGGYRRDSHGALSPFDRESRAAVQAPSGRARALPTLWDDAGNVITRIISDKIVRLDPHGIETSVLSESRN